jgi:hypothetical protein
MDLPQFAAPNFFFLQEAFRPITHQGSFWRKPVGAALFFVLPSRRRGRSNSQYVIKMEIRNFNKQRTTSPLLPSSLFLSLSPPTSQLVGSSLGQQLLLLLSLFCALQRQRRRGQQKLLPPLQVVLLSEVGEGLKEVPPLRGLAGQGQQGN